MGELILVVEDDEHVRELVSHTLQGAGYRVSAVADGEAAVTEVSRLRPDVVVLDVRLPGIDGWEVCRRVRALSDRPILFLTALGDEEHIVKGLRLGGDDYLAKPFAPSVLAARVQALLRRAAPGNAPRVVRLRGLTVELAAGRAVRDGELVRLTPTEFRILATLARQPGHVVGPGDLLRSTQGYDLPDHEAQEIVKVHVRHLRQKVEPEPEHPRYVLTIRGLGYMLNRDEVLEEEL